MPSCWIEVNLDAIRHNFRAIQDLVGSATSIIAVIKANAYGHGAPEIARTLAAEGAPCLAVTRLEEALPVRAVVETPILLLAPVLWDEVDEVVAHNLTGCISNYEDAERLSSAAARQHLTARAQLKINTGMGRLGVEAEEAIEVSKRIAELPNLKLEGVFTHFADAAEPKASDVRFQYGKFQPLIHHISRATGLTPHQFHCANSATLLRFPSMQISCVRPGTILYGQYPSPIVAEAAIKYGLKLRETFAAKARIIAIKTLQQGQKVGYGGEWTASRPSRIATLAIGYADGLTQEPQTRDEPPHVELRRTMRKAGKQTARWVGLRAENPSRVASVRGERVPIIGRIAMQQCSIDITHLPEVVTGDEVGVFMRRTSAGAHLPRIYVND